MTKWCVVLVTKKFAKCEFFRCHVAPVWAEGAKSLQEACMPLRLPVKFRPNLFRFIGVILEK